MSSGSSEKKTCVRVFRLVGLLLLVAMTGCHGGHTATDTEIFEDHLASLAKQLNTSAEDVPTDVLDKVPFYFGSLKLGMSPMQVFRTLKIPKVRLDTGMHDCRSYELGFEFRTNRYMTLTFNMLTKPPTFLEGHLYGEGWTVATNSANKNFLGETE